MTNEEKVRKNMDLAELIETLTKIGNQYYTWYGIETNVEFIEEVKCADGAYKVELKIKEG